MDRWPPSELDLELRLLTETEAATRSAIDHAMAKPAPLAELERLRARWIAAREELGYAIQRRRQ